MNTSSQSPLLVEEHRTSMRSAFEVGDHLTELAPIPPVSARVDTDIVRGWPAVGVILQFGSADAVAKFAAVVGVAPVKATDEFGGDWFTETTACGVLANVPFRAWARKSVAAATVHHLSVLDTAQAEQVLRDAIVRDPEQQVAYGESILLVTHPEIVVSTDADYGWWSPAMGCAPTPTRNSVQQVA